MTLEQIERQVLQLKAARGDLLRQLEGIEKDIHALVFAYQTLEKHAQHAHSQTGDAAQ